MPMNDDCICGVVLLIEDEEEVSLFIEDEEELEFILPEAVIIAEDYDVYTGEVEVTPTVTDQQILETAGKLVEDDITVKAVPVSIVTNPSGGLTYYID